MIISLGMWLVPSFTNLFTMLFLVASVVVSYKLSWYASQAW